MPTPSAGTLASTRTPPRPRRYPQLLEFYLKEQVVLEAKYAEMVEAGYDGYRAPYNNGFGMIFAMLRDPDGNTVLLSADPAPTAG